ncbi:MAG: hypothetical protein V7609_2060 [Verrucomicrobiota bacterium]
MKTRTKNLLHSTGPRAFVIQSGGDVKIHFAEKRKPKMEYPAGSIGADLPRRNYIRYLTERYFRFREADASFGPKAVRRFSYAVLFKNIETHFKAPTYFIPVARFDELVDFLQRRIEATILGKRNRARGHRNYETFDEFQLAQVVK